MTPVVASFIAGLLVGLVIGMFIGGIAMWVIFVLTS